MSAAAYPERKFVLAELVRQLNENRGRTGSTHLQKCVFFLQHMFGLRLGYKYMVYRYGPYSFDLENELAILRWQGWLAVEPDRQGYGVHYCLGPSALGLRFDVSAGDREAIASAVNHLASRPVRELELLATTYYLYKGVDGKKRDRRETVEAVLALKPHFNESDVEHALRELAEIEVTAGNKTEQ